MKPSYTQFEQDVIQCLMQQEGYAKVLAEATIETRHSALREHYELIDWDPVSKKDILCTSGRYNYCVGICASLLADSIA
jgi:hypothetical protein